MLLQEGVGVESPGPTGHDPTLALDKGLRTHRRTPMSPKGSVPGREDDVLKIEAARRLSLSIVNSYPPRYSIAKGVPGVNRYSDW